MELLEIAWRPGGAAIVEMVEMVYGLNLKHIHLAAQLGLDVGLLVQRREEAFGYMTFPKKHLATQTLYVTRVHLPPLQHMATLKSHKVPLPEISPQESSIATKTHWDPLYFVAIASRFQEM